MKENIYNSSFAELKSFFIKSDEKTFRADQLWNWLYVKGIAEFSGLNNISKNVINKINNKYYFSHFKVSKSLLSKDGTRKWLFELEDGKEIETVYIPDKNRGTICVSSQVGCPLSCSFCHTGTMKFSRNLSTSEILGQVMYVKNFLKDWSSKSNKKKITNIVFMGMGEPLLNYDNVIKAINVLTDQKGLAFSKRKVTLSTSGVAPKIINFKETSDNRYLIEIKGIIRFKIKKEYENNKKYRECEIDHSYFLDDLQENKEELKFTDLELIFKDLKSLFEKKGFIINWRGLEKQSLNEAINALAMTSPFTDEEKQVLLEAKNLDTRKNRISEILKTYTFDQYNNTTVQ